MTAPRLIFGFLLAVLALAVSACGGGSDSVPAGAVAVVDGTEISKAQLDDLVAQAKKGYESQKQAFPKAGTPEYQSIQTQYLAYLVQLVEFQKAADDRDLKVTEKDIDKAEQAIINEKFDGKRAEYEKALAQQGFTSECVPGAGHCGERPHGEALQGRDQGRRGYEPGDPRVLHRRTRRSTGRPTRATCVTFSSP